MCGYAADGAHPLACRSGESADDLQPRGDQQQLHSVSGPGCGRLHLAGNLRGPQLLGRAADGLLPVGRERDASAFWEPDREDPPDAGPLQLASDQLRARSDVPQQGRRAAPGVPGDLLSAHAQPLGDDRADPGRGILRLLRGGCVVPADSGAVLLRHLYHLLDGVGGIRFTFSARTGSTGRLFCPVIRASRARLDSLECVAAACIETMPLPTGIRFW